MLFFETSFLYFVSTLRIPSNKTGTVCFVDQLVTITAKWPTNLGAPSAYSFQIPDGCVIVDPSTTVASVEWTAIDNYPVSENRIGTDCGDGDVFLSSQGWAVPQQFYLGIEVFLFFGVNLKWQGLFKTFGELDGADIGWRFSYGKYKRGYANPIVNPSSTSPRPGDLTMPANPSCSGDKGWPWKLAGTPFPYAPVRTHKMR